MATKGLLNVSSAPSSASTCRRQGGNIEEMTTANVAEACSSKAANVGECSAFVLKMRKERVKQETASLLSTVARGILPKELAISPPEWFLLADSGANVHVLYDRTLLAFEKEANRFLGWGRGGDTCIAVGQLCCVTYMLHNNRWEKIVLHSGQPDTTWVVPVANRPLFSTIQARRQGHKSIEEGPHPGLQLGGESGQFIPYVSDPHHKLRALHQIGWEGRIYSVSAKFSSRTPI